MSTNCKKFRAVTFVSNDHQPYEQCVRAQINLDKLACNRIVFEITSEVKPYTHGGEIAPPIVQA